MRKTPPLPIGTQANDLIRVVPFHQDEWMFEYPRINGKVLDRFHEILEVWESGNAEDAAESLELLLDRFPEFIDAHHHLAIMFSEEGLTREAGMIWKRAAEVGRRRIPETFVWGKHTLPWMNLENRPFLRACQGRGLHLLRYGSYEKAATVFEEMLLLNPNDNQGVRAQAVTCHFALGRPERALATCDRYPGDGLPEILFGRPLALFQLQRVDLARKALRDAAKQRPNVAAELLKKAHRAPKGDSSPYVVMGGKDEAYNYWVENGRYWKKTPGALQFAAEVLEKPRR